MSSIVMNTCWCLSDDTVTLATVDEQVSKWWLNCTFTGIHYAGSSYHCVLGVYLRVMWCYGVVCCEKNCIQPLIIYMSLISPSFHTFLNFFN